MTVPGVWKRRRPEPGSLWTRYLPRRWPALEKPWFDLGAGRIRGLGEATRGNPGWPAASDLLGLDDVVYLPPVGAEHRDGRDRLLEHALENGVPVVIQRGLWEAGWTPRAGNHRAAAGTDVDGVIEVWDATPSVLEPATISGVRSGTPLPRLAHRRVLFPLVGGLALEASEWRGLCERLAADRVASVHPVTAELTPRQRRAVAARGVVGARGGAAGLPPDEAWQRLFHRPAPDERRYTAVALAAGIGVMAPRPLPRGPERLRVRRWLAGQLTVAGELWLRSQRPRAAGHSLLRSARKTDSCDLDLAGLFRDGNLRVVEWLAGDAGELVAELFARGTSALIRELENEIRIAARLAEPAS